MSGYNILEKKQTNSPIERKERSLTMYYFNTSMMTNEALMPRILAEDTGVTELRDPIFCAKTEFKLPKFRWPHRRKAVPCSCQCAPRCAASC